MFSLEEPLRTDRLTLRAFRPEDAGAVFDTRSRPEVVRYLYGDVQTREQVEVTSGSRRRASSTRATCSPWPPSADPTAG